MRLGERYLKIDVTYLTQGGFWLFLSQTAASGASLILAIAFANILSPEQYGIYRYVLAAAALLAIPTLSGINGALTQAVAAGKEETLHKAWKTKLSFGLISSLGALTGSIYYLINDNVVLSASFAIIAVFLPIMESYSLYSAFLHGRKNFKHDSIVHICIQIVAALSIIGVLFYTQNVVILVLTYFAFWTGGRMIAWFVVKKTQAPPTGGTDPRTIPFGMHLSAMSVISTIAQHIDRVFLFQHIGAAQVAIYTIALSMPEQLKALTKSINALLLPRFSTYSAETIRDSIWKKFGIMTAVLLGMIFLYIFAAPYIFALLFPQYSEAVIYSQILAISLVPVSTNVFLIALQALHKTKELYIINTIGPVIQVVLVIFGILFFGLIGAVIARVLARFTLGFLTVALYVRN